MVRSTNLNLMLTFKINPNHSISIKKNQQVLCCHPKQESVLSVAKLKLNVNAQTRAKWFGGGTSPGMSGNAAAYLCFWVFDAEFPPCQFFL